MEQRFVQHMQQREAARAAREAAMTQSTAAVQRAHFTEQHDALVQQVERSVSAGDVAAAQAALQQLRVLVQDTAHSVTLTAYDMARANSTLTRLQQRIAAAAADAQHASSNNDSSSSNNSSSSSHGGGGRRFRFSSRPTPAGSAAAAATITNTAEASRSDAGSGRDNHHDSTVAHEEEVAPQHEQQQQQQQQQQQRVYGGVVDTTVYVDAAPAVFVRQCRRCTLVALPTAGSVFVDDCVSCTLYVACHQLRMRNCHDIHVYVWCASTPIIEHCDGVCMGAYSAWRGLLHSTTAHGRRYATHEAWVAAVGDMDAHRPHVQSSYRHVSDFQWLTKTPSPHWRVVEPREERICDLVFVHGTTPSSPTRHAPTTTSANEGCQ